MKALDDALGRDAYCEQFEALEAGQEAVVNGWTLHADDHTGYFNAEIDMPGGGLLILDDYCEEYWALAGAMVLVDRMLADNEAHFTKEAA